MEKKFGVIIQGPVFSYGSGGRNDNPEGFDSTDTIKKNIEIIPLFYTSLYGRKHETTISQWTKNRKTERNK